MPNFKKTSLRYSLLKLWVKLGLKVYFRDIEVRGKEHIPKGVPIIFAVNHPSTVLDALLTASFVQQQPWFMARGDIFKRWGLTSLFRALRMLPVFRQRDGARQIKRNTNTFELSAQILSLGGSLIMFPEGSHNRQWRIRDMRRGIARIAQATCLNNPNLVIIPVGLTYFDPLYAFSDVLIQFGEPIKAQPFFADSNQHQLEQQNQLVAEISAQLQKLTLHISASNYEDVFARVKLLEQHAPTTDWLYEDFTRIQNWINACEKDQNLGREKSETVIEQIRKKTIPALALFVTAPLWFTGKVLAVVPQLIIRVIIKKLTDDHFTGAVRFGIGLVCYSLLFAGIGVWSYLSSVTILWFVLKWAYFTFCLFFVMLWEEHFDEFRERRFNRD